MPCCLEGFEDRLELLERRRHLHAGLLEACRYCRRRKRIRHRPGCRQIGPLPINALLVVAAQLAAGLVEDLAPARSCEDVVELGQKTLAATRPAVALPLLYSSDIRRFGRIEDHAARLLHLVERLLFEVDRYVRVLGLELFERLGPGDALGAIGAFEPPDVERLVLGERRAGRAATRQERAAEQSCSSRFSYSPPLVLLRNYSDFCFGSAHGSLAGASARSPRAGSTKSPPRQCLR